ncbi:MAG: glycosyltransferase [Bdellovibrionota bacterium]|nr:glycosyltransferase [Bdellovibrionota bacterium]MEC8624742.1 glycosyltransferase [Bdellovibrionota bacterium]
MKVLCITRLFSGIESSLFNKKWKPTGVPTIFKMIEKFDSEAEGRFIFTSKDGFTNWNTPKVETLKLEGLNHKITVLPGKTKFFFLPLNKLQLIARELFQFLYCLVAYFKEKPDFIYIDHANTLIAAFFARFTSTPVVYRVMGVYPFMRDVIKENSLKGRIFKFCYRSPFKQVICTQDGSGVEPWLETALHPNTKVEKLINGVDDFNIIKDTPESLATIPTDKTKVLFVGKIETAKGSVSFVESLILSIKQDPDIHAIVVGNGSKRESLIEKVKEEGLEGSFTFIQRLPHNEILKVHELSDIYISLNRLGNLSVANLEAMKFGQCMIFPKSQPETKIDFITDSLLEDNCAIRVENSDDIKGIKESILRLHKNKDEIQLLSTNMKKCAQKFIPTWEKRVSKEFTTITNAIKTS